jgi:hypothetical protein
MRVGTPETMVFVEASGVEAGFVVVSGPAASGKTVLARSLADAMGWPLLAKDTIKSALMSVFPVADVGAARHLGHAAVMAMLAVVSESRRGAVLEAVWRNDEGRNELSNLPGPVVEVFCRCDRAALEARYAGRVRHAGYVPEHRDLSELWSPETLEPMGLGWPVVEVDTTKDVDPSALVATVRRILG